MINIVKYLKHKLLIIIMDFKDQSYLDNNETLLLKINDLETIITRLNDKLSILEEENLELKKKISTFTPFHYKTTI